MTTETETSSMAHMTPPPMNASQMSDIIEIEQLLAKYAAGMTRDDVESVMEVFTADGWYSAFGDKYLLADFPALVAGAP